MIDAFATGDKPVCTETDANRSERFHVMVFE